MNRSHRIEMLFYSHPWALHLMAGTGIDLDRKLIFVEVATDSHLAALAPDPDARRLGLLPLLRQPKRTDLSSLGTECAKVPAPVILAANPPLPRQLFLDSLMLLDTRSFPVDAIVLLCHVAQATAARSIFPMVDRFHLLWDVADYPSEALLACARSLKLSGSLEGDRWGGFHLGLHPMRRSDSHLENSQLFGDMLAASGL